MMMKSDDPWWRKGTSSGVGDGDERRKWWSSLLAMVMKMASGDELWWWNTVVMVIMPIGVQSLSEGEVGTPYMVMKALKMCWKLNHKDEIITTISIKNKANRCNYKCPFNFILIPIVICAFAVFTYSEQLTIGIVLTMLVLLRVRYWRWHCWLIN